MPETDGYEYLIGYLYEVGPYVSNGMGPVPVSWQEILAWSQLSCPSLAQFEADAIKRLSAEYVSQLAKSEDADCPPPYQSHDAAKASMSAVEYGFRMLAQLLSADKNSKQKASP